MGMIGLGLIGLVYRNLTLPNSVPLSACLRDRNPGYIDLLNYRSKYYLFFKLLVASFVS